MYPIMYLLSYVLTFGNRNVAYRDTLYIYVEYVSIGVKYVPYTHYSIRAHTVQVLLSVIYFIIIIIIIICDRCVSPCWTS